MRIAIRRLIAVILAICLPVCAGAVLPAEAEAAGLVRFFRNVVGSLEQTQSAPAPRRSPAAHRAIPAPEKRATGGSSAVLSARLGTPAGWQAHHIIPVEAKGHRVLNRIGFDMDCVENGISLPGSPGRHPTLPVHRGYHAGYSREVIRELDAIPDTLSEAETRRRVMRIIDRHRRRIEAGTPLYGLAPIQLDAITHIRAAA